MDIKREDCTISNDINEIKSTWKDHFCGLLNQNQNEHGPERNAVPINDSNDTGMNGVITINEVSQALGGGGGRGCL